MTAPPRKDSSNGGGVEKLASRGSPYPNGGIWPSEEQLDDQQHYFSFSALVRRRASLQYSSPLPFSAAAQEMPPMDAWTMAAATLRHHPLEPREWDYRRRVSEHHLWPAGAADHHRHSLGPFQGCAPPQPQRTQRRSQPSILHYAGTRPSVSAQNTFEQLPQQQQQRWFGSVGQLRSCVTERPLYGYEKPLRHAPSQPALQHHSPRSPQQQQQHFVPRSPQSGSPGRGHRTGQAPAGTQKRILKRCPQSDLGCRFQKYRQQQPNTTTAVNNVAHFQSGFEGRGSPSSGSLNANNSNESTPSRSTEGWFYSI